MLFFAAQEAIANAAKHAKATAMEISFEEGKMGTVCRFTNDGIMPRDGVTFTGGLANLTRLAEEQGASIEVTIEGKFTLSLAFVAEK